VLNKRVRPKAAGHRSFDFPFLNEKDEKERGRAAGGRETLKRFYFRNRTEQSNKKQVWEFRCYQGHGFRFPGSRGIGTTRGQRYQVCPEDVVNVISPFGIAISGTSAVSPNRRHGADE
jgi:hypothetical protein